MFFFSFFVLVVRIYFGQRKEIVLTNEAVDKSIFYDLELSGDKSIFYKNIHRGKKKPIVK